MERHILKTGTRAARIPGDRKASVALLVRVFLIVAFLLFWQIYASNSSQTAFYTSYPTELLEDMQDFIVSGDLAYHLKITLKEAYLGLLYGAVLGLFFGVLLSQFSMAGRVLVPIVAAIQGIPQLTLAPIYILWFGIGIQSKIFLAGLMVFFNVFFPTYNSIKNVNQGLIESAAILGANKAQTLWYVVLPACTPWIISGVRMGASVCMVGAIMGEYLGAAGGIGWMVTYASSFLRIKRVMACIVVLMAIGLIVNWIFELIELRLLRWRAPSNLSMKMEKTV